MFLSGDTKVTKWGCSRCKNQPEGDPMRVERGCDSESDYLNFIWAPELKRCPWSQIDQRAMALWNLYLRTREHGQVLDLLDEPAWVWQAVAICGRVSASWQETQLRQVQLPVSRS